MHDRDAFETRVNARTRLPKDLHAIPTLRYVHIDKVNSAPLKRCPQIRNVDPHPNDDRTVHGQQSRSQSNLFHERLRKPRFKSSLLVRLRYALDAMRPRDRDDELSLRQSFEIAAWAV